MNHFDAHFATRQGKDLWVLLLRTHEYVYMPAGRYIHIIRSLRLTWLNITDIRKIFLLYFCGVQQKNER